MKLSPCTHCTKVPDARQCNNKDCAPWRRWYLEQWENMRAQVKENTQLKSQGQEGCSIGGVRYALPHRVKGYLDTDPCRGCMCPKELCLVPCAVKRRWQSARQTVYGN